MGRLKSEEKQGYQIPPLWEPSWGSLGVLLERLGGLLGRAWVLLGGSWCALGVFHVRLEAALGHFKSEDKQGYQIPRLWEPFGGGLGLILGPLGSLLGRSGLLLGVLGELSGSCRCLLRRPWGE